GAVPGAAPALARHSPGARGGGAAHRARAAQRGGPAARVGAHRPRKPGARAAGGAARALRGPARPPGSYRGPSARARARAPLAGAFTIVSRPGAGTDLTISIPVGGDGAQDRSR